MNSKIYIPGIATRPIFVSSELSGNRPTTTVVEIYTNRDDVPVANVRQRSPYEPESMSGPRVEIALFGYPHPAHLRMKLENCSGLIGSIARSTAGYRNGTEQNLSDDARRSLVSLRNILNDMPSLYETRLTQRFIQEKLPSVWYGLRSGESHDIELATEAIESMAALDGVVLSHDVYSTLIDLVPQGRDC